MSTKEQREAWQVNSDSATPGPWKRAKQEYDSHDAMAHETALAYSHGGHVLHYLVVAGAQFPAFTGNGPSSMANACFIAAAREAVPALLQDVERLTAALNASRITKSPVFVSISFYDKDIEKHNARIDAALDEVSK